MQNRHVGTRRSNWFVPISDRADMVRRSAAHLHGDVLGGGVA